MSAKGQFVPLNLAVLTVSDSRTLESDSSGQFLVDALTDAGHRLHERKLLRDDRYAIRAQVAAWIADAAVYGVLIAGSDEAFIATAARFGNDRPALTALRQRLEAQRTTSGLFDVRACANDFAALLREMDDRHRNGLSPAPITTQSPNAICGYRNE